MTFRYIAAAAVALLAFTVSAGAQAKNDHTQFNDKDRQVTSDWYKQHQANPPVGFRSKDQLSPDLEVQLKVGSVLNVDLQKRVTTVPTDLRRQLTTPAPGYRYVAVGGHVAMVDKKNQVQDVIHVHP